MSFDVVSAVGGGLVTGVVAVGWRLLDVPAKSRNNDAGAVARARMLGHWIGDRHERLARESTELRRSLGNEIQRPVQEGTGLFPPTPEEAIAAGSYEDWHRRAHEVDVQISQLRGEALREFRDERERTYADVAGIYAQEDWLHGAYRRTRRKFATPVLISEDLAAAVASWRKASHMDTASQPVAVDDASTRTDHDVRLTVRGGGP